MYTVQLCIGGTWCIKPPEHWLFRKVYRTVGFRNYNYFNKLSIILEFGV